MDILNLITEFLSKNNFGKIGELFNYLSSNGFNLKSSLENLTPEKLSSFMSLLSSIKKEPPQNVEVNGLLPIKSIADEEIIQALNEYFSD